MSRAVKTRLTEVIIKESKATRVFRLSSEVGRGLLKLLTGLEKSEDTNSVLAEEVFPGLKDPEKRVGITFRGIRFKHNLTQEEVAKRLGIDQSDVSKIEKGKRAVGKALAKKIEQEFGIDYRRLL